MVLIEKNHWLECNVSPYPSILSVFLTENILNKDRKIV